MVHFSPKGLVLMDYVDYITYVKFMQKGLLNAMGKQLEKKCSVILNFSFDVLCDDQELADELIADLLSGQLISYYAGKIRKEIKVQDMELNEVLEMVEED